MAAGEKPEKEAEAASGLRGSGWAPVAQVKAREESARIWLATAATTLPVCTLLSG